MPRYIIIAKCTCQGLFAELETPQEYTPPSECPDCGEEISITWGVVTSKDIGRRGNGLAFETIQLWGIDDVQCHRPLKEVLGDAAYCSYCAAERREPCKAGNGIPCREGRPKNE